MKQTIFILAVLIISSAYGQETTLEWAKHYKGNQLNSSSSLILDDDNNSYIGGYFRGSVDFDPSEDVLELEYSGPSAGFIQKNDPNGGLIWVKKIVGTSFVRITNTAIDDDNNILLSGFFNEVVDADPGAGEYVLSKEGTGLFEGFLIKLNSDGEFIWAKKFGSHNGGDDFINILVDPNKIVASSNHIYVSGSFKNEINFGSTDSPFILTGNGGNDVFCMKFTNEGELLDVFQLGGDGDDEARVYINGDDLYLAGSFEKTCDLDLGAGIFDMTSSSISGKDGFIAKYDLNGDFIWAHAFGDVEDDAVVDLTFDYLGNPCFTGYFEGDIYVGSPEYSISLSGTDKKDVFLIKLSKDGVPIWGQSFNGPEDDNPTSLVSDGVNNYLLVRFRESLDVDPSADITTVFNVDAEEYNQLIIKLNLDGGLLWAGQQNGRFTDSQTEEIQVDEDENLYGIGTFESVVDVDPTETTLNIVPSGLGDYLFYKLNTSETLRATELFEVTDIVVYPNPVVDVLMVRSDQDYSKLRILSMDGKELLSTNHSQISVADLSSGTYLIEISSEANLIRQTFVKK